MKESTAKCKERALADFVAAVFVMIHELDDEKKIIVVERLTEILLPKSYTRGDEAERIHQIIRKHLGL
ncbi:MAG: hypothetical protein COA42_04700 [Alteromonadaceae bacterium]|nr:MAG: hypothetical protein COA42_04700 [Alteromonadaceae bacterium]